MRPGRATWRGSATAHLLSGLLICDRCGAGRDIPRYVFHVQGPSELVARLSDIERQARLRA